MGAGKAAAESRERKEKVRIGFITPSLSVCGGLQRVQTLLANELADKHQVIVIALEDGHIPPYYELDRRVQVIYEDVFQRTKNPILWRIVRAAARKYQIVLPEWMAKNAYYPAKVIRVLQEKWKKDGYDCLVASTAFCSILLGLMAEKLTDVKTIGWHHNSFFIYFRTPGKGAYIQQKLAGNALKRLDALVTLTRQDKEAYKRWMNLDAKYIYNPLSFSSEKKTDVHEKKLLFVSRLETRQKGLDFLVRVADILFHQRGYVDWKLEIIGAGSGMEETGRMIAEYGLENYIELLGEKKNVTDYYTRASVFLCTSRWEGFGMVVTEAMECGLPVVSFKTDGPSEIIRDGESGYLIDNFDLEQFADAVERLMKDEGLRKEMSRHAMVRAKDFSIVQIGEEWEKLFKDPEGYQNI